MNAVSIQEVVAHTTEAFRQHGYTNATICEKERILLQIVALHEKFGDNLYNPDVVGHFTKESEERYMCGDISRVYYRFLMKTATYLIEFRETGTIRFAGRYVPKLSDYYENLLDKILAYDGWNRKNSHSIWTFAKTYFNWLYAITIPT